MHIQGWSLKFKTCLGKTERWRQRWMYVTTAILKLWNFDGRDAISDYEFSLPILNAFAIDTRCYKVNDVWMM